MQSIGLYVIFDQYLTLIRVHFLGVGGVNLPPPPTPLSETHWNYAGNWKFGAKVQTDM